MSASLHPSESMPGGGVAAARAQYQGVLDNLNKALQSEDVEACAAHFALPLMISNMDGTLRADTRDALHDVLTEHLQACRARGLTRVGQTCKVARIDRSGCLEGCHLTRLSRKGTPGTEAVYNRLVMTREDEGWKILRVETGLDRGIWPMHPDRLVPVDGRTLCDTQFRAYTIFQGVLNATTLHVLNGDTDGFAEGAAFPIFVQSRKGRFTIDGPEALREDIALYQEEFRIHGVDDVYRPLKSAEFVGPDKISGTYTTYILSRGRLVVAPYESAMTLQRCPNGLWCITSIMHGVGHLDWKPPGDEA